jgi:hypothetical protein
MQTEMRQELGRSPGLLAVDRTGWNGMRILRHESESRDGTTPKPAPVGRGNAESASVAMRSDTSPTS